MRRKILHQKWVPHDYQKVAIKRLLNEQGPGLLLPPGYGKTSIVLQSIVELQKAGKARKVLIVAPKRVCQTTWPLEIQKWTQFRHLKWSLVQGTPKQRTEALAAPADIYLTNPEQVPWLVEQAGMRRNSFDVLVLDELTKFKSWSSKRVKALKPYLPLFKYRWGLTGSLRANGLQDIFSQIYCLDIGKTFGKYITRFYDAYFTRGRFQSQLFLKPGAEEDIHRRLSTVTTQVSTFGHIKMPKLVTNQILVDLPPEARVAYETMEEELMASIGDKVVVSPSVSAALIRCRQIASGALYYNDSGSTLIATGPRKWVDLHSEKLDAVEELLEELQGSPLFVAYIFEHDRERLLKRFPEAVDIGKAKDPGKLIAKWNAGKIPMMLGHPQSVGHGLNLQEACHNVCWFSLTYNLEGYEQFNGRVYRQGNNTETVFIHQILARDTVDIAVARVLQNKSRSSNGTMQALIELQKLFTR